MRKTSYTTHTVDCLPCLDWLGLGVVKPAAAVGHLVPETGSIEMPSALGRSFFLSLFKIIIIINTTTAGAKKKKKKKLYSLLIGFLPPVFSQSHWKWGETNTRNYFLPPALREITIFSLNGLRPNDFLWSKPLRKKKSNGLPILESQKKEPINSLAIPPRCYFSSSQLGKRLNTRRYIIGRRRRTSSLSWLEFARMSAGISDIR